MSYGKLRHYLACALTRAEGQGGQALGEFTLVVALVALGAVIALTAVGVAVGGFYESFAELIS